MTLRFNSKGKFKIVQFTDIHWMNGNEIDQKTRKLMERILDWEQPDFVVFTGDTVYGEKNKENFLEAVKAVDQAQIYWAAVYGNHDTEWGADRKTLNLEQRKSPNCLTQLGDGDDLDYFLQIEGRDGRPKWTLYFMDSGFVNSNAKIGGYDYLKRSQINWYVDQAVRIKEEYGDLPALAFFHIPLPEYNELWDYCHCYGQKNESVCCPKQNSGMFSAMLEMGDVKGVFVGHDHVNDYYGQMYGIKLCYGRASGYNTYSQEGFAHGARIIELDELSHDFITWIRSEDGSKIIKQPEHGPEKIREDI